MSSDTVRVSLADLRNRAEPRDRITLRSSEVLALVAAVEAAVEKSKSSGWCVACGADMDYPAAHADDCAFAPFTGQPEGDA